MSPTHRLVGGTTGFVVSTTAGLPMTLGVAVGAISFASSSLPDSTEKLFRLPHRQITHYPVIQLAVIGALTFSVIAISPIPTWAVVFAFAGIALGCLMHSLADAMTIDPRGIALLWPISSRGYHLTPRWARVRVGTKSTSEWAFVAIWCLIVLSYTYARYRHLIFT